jgi:uncharacterized membrane protein
MTLLILGVALFTLLHLVPFFALKARAAAKARLGENGYKGLYSLASLGALVLIYFGWTATSPLLWYDPPAWAFHVTPLIVLFAFLSFFASGAPTNIKRLVRHPQLAGVLLWGVGHLLANGEDRSVILFGGFALWSVVAMIGSNRRDGAWVKPPRQPVVKDIITVMIGLGLYAAVALGHEYVIGVSPFPG